MSSMFPAPPSEGGDERVMMEQLRTFLYTYNKLTEHCFEGCVSEFPSDGVNTTEDTCAINCASKFLKMAQRIGLRFQEIQETGRTPGLDLAIQTTTLMNANSSNNQQ